MTNTKAAVSMLTTSVTLGSFFVDTSMMDVGVVGVAMVPMVFSTVPVGMAVGVTKVCV